MFGRTGNHQLFVRRNGDVDAYTVVHVVSVPDPLQSHVTVHQVLAEPFQAIRLLLDQVIQARDLVHLVVGDFERLLHPVPEVQSAGQLGGQLSRPGPGIGGDGSDEGVTKR